MAPQPSSYSTRSRPLTTYKNYLHCCLSTVPGVYHCDESRASLYFKDYHNTSRVLGTKRATSLTNHISILKHFFALFEWPTSVFSTKKVLSFIKSVQINAALNFQNHTGVFSVYMHRKLIQAIQKYANAKLYIPLFFDSLYGFFRLASRLPNAIGQFDKTRHPIQNDLNFGPSGLYLSMPCSKTMQTSGQVQVVKLQQLNNQVLCSVQLLKVIGLPFQLVNICFKF